MAHLELSTSTCYYLIIIITSMILVKHLSEQYKCVRILLELVKIKIFLVKGKKRGFINFFQNTSAWNKLECACASATRMLQDPFSELIYDGASDCVREWLIDLWLVSDWFVVGQKTNLSNIVQEYRDTGAELDFLQRLGPKSTIRRTKNWAKLFIIFCLKIFWTAKNFYLLPVFVKKWKNVKELDEVSSTWWWEQGRKVRLESNLECVWTKTISPVSKDIE